MPRRISVPAVAMIACLLLSGALAPGAGAVPKLRVEGPAQTLDPGTLYTTHDARIGRADASCNPTAGNYNATGRTPMGLIGAAAEANRRLRPVRATEDFGAFFVCNVGSYAQTLSPFRGWAYRVNNAFPLLGANEQRIGRNDTVLWYFIDYGSGQNTGDALALSAPARSAPGKFQVAVNAHPFSGGPVPAPDGTLVMGGDATVATVGGLATVTASSSGSYRLRAAYPTYVPSASLQVCVASPVGSCPAARGESMIGSRKKDKIKGTKGPDSILARGGDDRIGVRGGGIDRVKCGRGRDVVRADAGDKVSGCERIRR